MWRVAPRAGAWIETPVTNSVPSWNRSPPARGRGLKHESTERGGERIHVAPRAGAWIETSYGLNRCLYVRVAPRAGAWIETIECLRPAIPP